ncbi:ATP phosphoribosyltransferase regulatory subunit [uncultured Clostridium sp.]|uniref:ATP phosphoribosyltransferase regulatory subunit n=1 Tax=uncultured Clostridium sp. TaxID=59620 RepID=UPI00262A6ECB|nr:ATP phosphoribosyltransferase regulatory subunit [uncultured Clostridium sp.]
MRNKNVIPDGTRDLIFEESKKREYIIKNLEKTYKSFGYRSIVTPTIEYYKTFFNEIEGLREEEVYKFFDNSGRILVLRPDMTIPISRVVKAKMRDVELPIRLRYTSNIFNVNKSLGGKRNEYIDCGIEFIGESSLGSDIEVLTLALEGIKSVGVKKFKLEIGNINFFNSISEEINLKGEEREKLAKLIESKSLIELKEFLDLLGIEEKYKKFLNNILWLFGDEKILDKALKYSFNEDITQSLNYMKKVYSILESLGYKENISFDLGMVPRVNYYTGIIFKGYIDGVGDTVLSGGRYDNLIKKGKEKIHAIGFSINVDLLTELPLENVEEKKMIITYREEDILKGIREGERLRREGFITELKFLKGIKKGEGENR